jgi:glutamate--cysteine ligase
LSDQFQRYLETLSDSQQAPLLRQLQRGIEKESLRVNPEGGLAQTDHPIGLGSALTHPAITTDFSEALLELITPVNANIDDSLQQLDDVHRFVYSQLQQESMWVASMPCVLKDGENIPLARYGSSNVAQMKTAYRRGLGNRYGRAMQTIAGIHYNFSVPDALWPVLQKADNDDQPLQDYVTDRYFALIRNFRRFSWLLLYLFGASPAVCKSFVGRQAHMLDTLRDDTLYLPYATTLRMGDLGYQSNAQQDLAICYNTLDNYLHTLCGAITQPHHDYQSIGLKVDGKYQQLSTALLQIENEFYSAIRPKRVARSGETALSALKNGGVEYIEVRCVDVNPFLPLGIDAEQIRFMDSFLLYCLLKESPQCDEADRQRIANNQGKVVNEGRRPGLTLNRRDGEISLQAWGEHLLSGIEDVAQQLDKAHGGNDYRHACQQQRAKLLDPSLTPSAKILAELEQGQSFYAFAMQQSRQHQQYFCQPPLSPEKQQSFEQLSQQSLQRQAEVEAEDSIDFDQYLEQYYQQYQAI